MRSTEGTCKHNFLLLTYIHTYVRTVYTVRSNMSWSCYCTGCALVWCSSGHRLHGNGCARNSEDVPHWRAVSLCVAPVMCTYTYVSTVCYRVHMQSDYAVNCGYACHFRSGRICTEDSFVGDLFLKKGVQILIQIFSIHHDPELWSDPEKFDPDRYAWSGDVRVNACHLHTRLLQVTHIGVAV